MIYALTGIQKSPIKEYRSLSQNIVSFIGLFCFPPPWSTSHTHPGLTHMQSSSSVRTTMQYPSCAPCILDTRARLCSRYIFEDVFRLLLWGWVLLYICRHTKLKSVFRLHLWGWVLLHICRPTNLKIPQKYCTTAAWAKILKSTHKHGNLQQMRRKIIKEV